MQMTLPKHYLKHLCPHLVAWIIFIVYEVSFVEMIRGASLQVSVWNGYVLPYIINISFFYFHAGVTMRIAFEKKRKILLFGFLVALEVAAYLFLMGAKDWNFTTQGSNIFSSLFSTRLKFIQHLWRGIYFLIFSTAYWLIQKSFQNEKRLKEAEHTALLKQQEQKELELQLVSTQNAFLQSQINPHLLFNSLNFIHSEVQQLSPTASEAIIVLSDMMRYSLYETKADGKVGLDREIEQIGNLVTINQFRFNHKLCIRLQSEGAFTEVRIIPLLLLPFVENLFKYAALMDEANPVLINAFLKGEYLCFETHNRKRKTIQSGTSGIGINNVKRRLKAYYPGQFFLDINESEYHHSVKLELKL